MLVDRIVKENTDVSRVIVDLDEFLDPSEVVTAIVSASIAPGTTGWGLVPFPPAAMPPPYDPTPLLYLSHTMDAANRTLIFFVEYGTPGLFYTCTFVLAGTSVRQTTIEIIVQITGIPPVQQNIALPQNPPPGGYALPLAGGQMTGPLYLFEDPIYPTEAATKYYVDHVAGIAGGPFLSLGGGTMTGPIVLSGPPIAPLDAVTKSYVDGLLGVTTGNWLPITGGTMTGMLTLAGDPQNPLDAVDKRYIDNNLALYLPLGGGTMTGMLTLAADPVSAMQPVTLQYFNAHLPTGGGGASVSVGDTPPASPSVGNLWWDSVGGELYIWFADPTSSEWVLTNNFAFGGGYLALTGGTMTGPITLSADPASAMQPVTLQYFNANLPVGSSPSTTLPIMDGTASVGTGTTWARADHVHPSDTSRLTQAQTDARYLQLSGGTLTGTLTLAADPTTSLQAATKAYVDSKASGGTAGVTSFNTRTGAVTLVAADVSGASGFLVTGGTVSGTTTIAAGFFEHTTTMAAATTIDLATGSAFAKTISGATTFTLANVPASGNAATFLLDLTNGGSATITWWANVRWPGGTAPTLTASGRDLLGFYSGDGGANWNGLLLGKGMA